MDLLGNMSMGFSIAFSPVNLLFVTLGVIAGTLIGAMPGIGPTSGVAILIPLAFGMNPTTALILMCGVYYGAMYGGTLTSVLMNVPGESSSVMTCLDGHAMALKGRAGPALSIAAIGSFIAGTFSVVLLMLLAPPIADAALNFGPPEYFALMLLGLMAASGITGRSRVKGYAMLLVGLVLAMVGLDIMTPQPRFDLGRLELLDGIEFLPIAVGLFGVSQVLTVVESSVRPEVLNTTLREMIITSKDIRDSVMPIARGTVIGFLIGVLPGAGPTIASFLAYSTEKQVSKHPELFGTGVIEGVAAPESANNGATGGSLIPLLTLGIPGSGATAVMLGALAMFNIQPGPLLLTRNSELVWGLIASMYIGNVMLLVLNIVFVPAFVSVLRVPYEILTPVIVVFCMVGVYSIEFSMFDLGLMFGAGILGYFMKKLEYPAAPVILALVLGGEMERALRRSLKLFHGDILMFFTRPISGTILAVIIVIALWPLLSRYVLKLKLGEAEVADARGV